MSLADNIAMQLIEAIGNCTPENLKKIAEAKAAALKLTEPEKAARAEYAATIATADAKLKALKDAESKDADTKARIVTSKQELESGQQALKNAKDDHAKNVKANADKETDLANREAALALEKKRVESVSKANEAETNRLKLWADDLADQESSFEQAQQLIKKRK